MVTSENFSLPSVDRQPLFPAVSHLPGDGVDQAGGLPSAGTALNRVPVEARALTDREGHSTALPFSPSPRLGAAARRSRRCRLLIRVIEPLRVPLAGRRADARVNTLPPDHPGPRGAGGHLRCR